jgi:hypothetical protein
MLTARFTFGRRSALAAALAVLLVLVGATEARAALWAEQGDAGSFLSDAQVPVGTGSLDHITGSIDSVFPHADEDVYKVCLTGSHFSAITSTHSDPMLYLFDGHGRVVAFNDDDLGLESRLTVPSPAPGTYYLAIVSFANVALDGHGNGLFAPGDGPLVHWSENGFNMFHYTITLTGARPCATH